MIFAHMSWHRSSNTMRSGEAMHIMVAVVPHQDTISVYSLISEQ